MLVIRLQRTGRENLPRYRVVVAEKARPVKGKFLEVVGTFRPTSDPVVFEYKNERIVHWVKQGAIPSDTVARLLKRAGLDGMDTFIVKYAKRKSKKEQAAVLAAAQAPEKAKKVEGMPPQAEKQEKQETEETNPSTSLGAGETKDAEK